MTRRTAIRVSVVATVVIIAALGLFVVRPTVIVGESMTPTLQSWDFCLMLRSRHYEPHRGDIVMFRTADDPPLWLIKRVVALPGETIAIDRGVVTINGTPLPEPYTTVNPGWALPPTPVPADRVYVIGDNRTVAAAETWHGLVATRLVKGRQDLVLEMETMKWLLRLGFLLVLVLLGWWVKERFFVTDDTRIKRLIATMTTAVEQNKTVALADCIAGDFNDDHGLDKASLLGAIRSVRMQYDALFIHISDLALAVAPDHATAQATLVAKVLTRRAGGGETELNADRIRLFFRKTDDGWKLTRAESPELKFE